VGSVNCEVETPGLMREKKIFHVKHLEKWHVLPNVALLVEDRGNELEKMEQTEVAIWDGTCYEHFFPYGTEWD